MYKKQKQALLKSTFCAFAHMSAHGAHFREIFRAFSYIFLYFFLILQDVLHFYACTGQILFCFFVNIFSLGQID